MIHEYAHMFMDRNYEYEEKLLPRWLDEGMADTFSDLVINNYFKYEEAEIDDEKLNFKLPYVSYSAYLFENSYVRTLLYPLEQDGKDKEAVMELLLGSPKKFLEMTVNKDFSEEIEYTEHGIPLQVDLDRKFIYLNKEEYYKKIDTSSIYYLKNSILPGYRINEKIQDLDEVRAHELDDFEYNNTFIKNSYFHGKKIYELSALELKDFLEIYVSSRCTNFRFFLSGSYNEFINDELNDLLNNKEEIINNSDNILDIMPYLIDYELSKMGINMYEVIAISLKNILNKIKKMEFNDTYIQSVHYKLKNIVIPAFKNLSDVEHDDTYNFLMELLENSLKIIENKVVSIDVLSSKASEYKKIGNGTSKVCFDLDDCVLLKTYSDSCSLDNYYFLNYLNKSGVNTPKIISQYENQKNSFFLEEKAIGTSLQEYTPKRIYPVGTRDDLINNYNFEREYVRNYLDRLRDLSSKPDVLEKFVDDYFKIIQSGGFVDPSKTSNFVYNEKGIYFIDLSYNPSRKNNDENFIFYNILYIVSWCSSSCFIDDEVVEESNYLNNILNLLKEICVKKKLDLNKYFVDYNGNDLTSFLNKRYEYRKEYKLSSLEEYLEYESGLLANRRKV